MSPEQRAFLSLLILPARLNISQAAWLLGFTEQDVSTLIALKLLKPLGRPPPSGSKYFALSELQVLRSDPPWLAKASDAIVGFWRRKNSKRRTNLKPLEHCEH